MDVTCYTTASLPVMLGPKARALSYLVPTKYLFLPYSQTQPSEIPFSIIHHIKKLSNRLIE